MSNADGIRRDSLAAGRSRTDRYGRQRAVHRDPTARVITLDASRRESEGLPFSQDEAADQAHQQEDEHQYDDDTPATSTPRSHRTSSRTSASASATKSASRPAASAAKSTSRSSSKQPLPIASPKTPRTPRTPRTPSSPVAPASSRYAPASSASPSNKRFATQRPNDTRVSRGYSPPFPASRRASTRSSYAPSNDDEDIEEDQLQVEQTTADADQFEFNGGDVGQEDEQPMEVDAEAENDAQADEPAAGTDGDSLSPKQQKSKGTKRKQPSQPAARPKASGGGRVGRRTFGIITQATVRHTAHELGMIDEEDDNVGSGDEGTARKRQRPTRNRLRPIDWWTTQELNYVRTETGIGGMMPVLDPAKPVVQHVKIQPPKPKVVKPRPRSKTPKPSKPNGSASVAPDELDLSSMDDIPPYMTVLDPEQQEIQVQSMAKHLKHIPLEKLGGGPNSDLLPHGGKAFEQPEFSSGILQLPPRAKKQREVANNNEIFYVISGPVNGLTLTLHTSTMRLSPGTQFMIPAGNTYELHNTSLKDKIDLMFVLVKPAALWMAECREQLEHHAQQAAEEEDEDERVHRSKAAGKFGKGRR